MKSTVRIDAAFELVVALGLILLIVSGTEMPIPGRRGGLAVLAIIFCLAGLALWSVSSGANSRLVGVLAIANAAGGLVVGGWLAVELTHLPRAGGALALATAVGFFAVAALEVAKLRPPKRPRAARPRSD